MKNPKLTERNLLDSFNDAIEGLIQSFRSERNMKIHFIIAFFVLCGALFYELSKVETVLLFMAIVFVIVMEMINTSIETIIDMIQEDYHPLAKIAKNVAAGAVLVAAINAVAIGYILFYDKIDNISLSLINRMKTMPVHITAASLFIVVISVIIVKNINKTGTFLKGGMPSGHSAIAFSLFTCIAIISSNALISGLSFLIALIVFHSRYESGVHTLFEVTMGAILGTLVTILAFQIARL
ncbi:MAG TPA: diacylglycerol kinase [Clostridia bacterium]|nr:diacylglycerol kinase [Clostridia bacterium]